MSTTDHALARSLEHVLRRVRNRHILVRSGGDALFTAAVAVAAMLVFAWVVGPTASRIATPLVGGLALSPVVAFLVTFARLRRRLDAPAVAELYRSIDAGLASRTRSATELARVPTRGESQELLNAHLGAVVAEVSRHSAARVVDARARLRRPARTFATALVALGVAWLLSDRVRMGAYALLHPNESVAGQRVALVVADLQYHVSPPAYRRLPDRDVGDVASVVVPDGSRVRVTVRTTFDAERVDLRLPETEVSLHRVAARTYAGELVARRGGRLDVRVHSASDALIDAKARNVVLDEDASPRVVFELYGAESPVPPDAEVGFHLEASDDVGLSHVSRVIRVPSGVEWRVPLDPGAVVPSFAQEGAIRVAELGLRPGDAVEVYAEATDVDEVRGPKTTRSPTRTIVVASRSTAREAASVDLHHALDAALAALADRLEHAVGTEGANERRALVAASTATLLEALRSISSGGRESGLSAPDTSLVATLSRRVASLAARESSLPLQDARSLADVDRRLVSALEEGALALADVLAHLELEDAAEIARELDSLRRELVSLVEALRRSDSEETRLRIAADIERARRRMNELASRLARMGDEIPGEYRNQNAAATTPRTEDALRDLERALAANDLAAADRALAELEHQVQSLAKAFQEDANELGDSRFGPRERAFQEAIEALAGLEAEQSTLADETTRVRRAATERALEATHVERTAATRALADRARRLRDEAQSLSRAPGVPVDHDLVQRSVARLDDVESALREGDVGAAQESMERARRELDATARDLEVASMMFPGRGGRTREAAERARRASEAARELFGDVLREMPRLSEQLDSRERDALASGHERQQAAREATGRLSRRFAEEIGGAPLSEEAAAELESIGHTMGEAEGSLRDRDAIASAESQGAAARRLRDLRESLERASGGGGGGAEGGGGGGGGSDGPSGAERVEIPGAAGSSEIAARRRRVLDAMGGDVPDAYRGAVERYYQELLR